MSRITKKSGKGTRDKGGASKRFPSVPGKDRGDRKMNGPGSGPPVAYIGWPK